MRELLGEQEPVGRQGALGCASSTLVGDEHEIHETRGETPDFVFIGCMVFASTQRAVEDSGRCQISQHPFTYPVQTDCHPLSLVHSWPRQTVSRD